MTEYRVVKRTEFNSKREKCGEHWIVQYAHTYRFLWFKPKTKWKTVARVFWTENGDYSSALTFEKEDDAFAYIDRTKKGIPKDTVVEEVVVQVKSE